jgi:hypothetical protein
MIQKLEDIPNWGAAVAAASDSKKDPKLLAEEFGALLDHIKDTKDSVSVTLVRRYMQMVEQMTKLAKGAAPPPPRPAPPKPVPQIKVAPKPKPIPKPKPKPVPEKLPPAPPGIKCPHYTQGSAFPKNWDDPEAEQRYLKGNPDVKMWVAAMKKRKSLKGRLNALWHYRCYGAKEKRTWAGLDGFNRQIPGYLS